MLEPKVSVVMGVHNSAHDLAATLDSVLEQDCADLEFIVVDDGSTDETGDVLAIYAKRDPRVRVLTSEVNQGLTAALIRGCAAARGCYIARQDAGDQSLAGRLSSQVSWLNGHPDASMVSCHTRFIGLYGEQLFERRISASELRISLCDGIEGSFLGPTHHGTVMMRRSAYQCVGGYRHPFVVAQDLDLWLRLAEVGGVGVVDMVGYESKASPEGISAQRADLQSRLAGLAGDLARARRSRNDESDVLSQFRASSIQVREPSSPLSRRYRYAAYTYFLGRCVTSNNPVVARRYFLNGLMRCPWHLRSWYGLAASAFR